jgi:hypothetical protein
MKPNRIFSISIASLLWITAPNPRAADFTVDPARSSITISGNAMGFALSEQGPGSLTTQFEGTLKADITEASIVLGGGSVVALQNNGSWKPLAGGLDGSAPANCGGKADGGILGKATAAVRSAQFDVTSPLLPVTGGNFDSASLLFRFLSTSPGSLDYAVSSFFTSQKGSVQLAGLGTNRVTAKATIATSGNVQTLTIPIISDFQFKMISEGDTKLTITGQIVATRTVGGGGGNTFDTWVGGQFPGQSDAAIVGPGADPDKDGIPNFVEYAFGLNPNSPNPSTQLLKAALDPAKPGQAVLEYVRPKGLSGVGVNYLLRVSDSLSSWTPLTASEEVTDLGNGTEKVVIRDTVPAGGQSSRFIILSVGAK